MSECERHSRETASGTPPRSEGPTSPRAVLDFVEEAVKRLGGAPDRSIPILQAIQEHFGYLPEEALRRVSEISEITPSALAGVSTFYNHFRRRPAGRHRILACNGTACHVRGAGLVHDALRARLNIEGDSDTDPTGEFTVEKAFCLGCCTLAPVVQMGDSTYSHVSPDSVPAILMDFRAMRDRDGAAGEPPSGGREGRADGEIRICLDSCCVARGCGRTHEAIHRALAETGIRARVKRVACVVLCEQTPLVEIALPGSQPITFSRVAPGEVRDLLLRYFKPSGLANRVRTAISTGLDRLLTGEDGARVLRREGVVRDPPVPAFFGRQKHVATEHFGQLDPLDLDEVLAHEGFQALKGVVEARCPERVIETIRRSGLRGRGGAGFPTAAKWERMLRAPAGHKVVVGNGDEGDPGAFMDRMLMESFPYRVIEGMAIAACTVGVHEGIFYIRAEYPFAVRRMQSAIEACEARGILGLNVLGSGFGFHVRIARGAGAFVCGEETALIESLEGRRGIPRLRPPYPVESGLRGLPTLVQNVETLAVVPWILRNGAEAFATLGTEKSRGTKVFALAGKVNRGGLIEVPMGITLREIVEEIGGGVAGGRRFKAVLIGGPSGGCVPAELAHTPVDYESLASAGAIMGSGGLIVLDDSDCMVDIARYFLGFCQNESCGKCTFCRVGTRRMLEILERLCAGHGQKDDLDRLEQLAQSVRLGSLCGLGRTAPNPVTSTLRYFRHEYEAHLGGRCPAGRCKALITYSITDSCVGCTLCAQHCPADAIAFTPLQRHRIATDLCTRCDTCRKVCPENAVEVR
ncbi:MAG: NAD(P)H-dependent oxidoreductase subunit E [Planctomycetes bacterium]|nr:NAD(P)H-dependent oxidoreductase subunit E [Planctomycetota bacterium]